ncbi:hypothetical protein WQE_04897 [Paraburkholderia hospita]|uniref:Uncharacterized protein n=1 Tax=Paraburkholderia hospita TaxID=169430 RepID=A0ABN0FU56_9BURK|nr:hypothetical protein [Paraburkholderia hospita]EIN02298.1 hypothetical protein WQE_04897 [Paraburkholderia hospita]OUL72640.1 hypothetical protein CA602_42925 [Paraburkholderia hospita]
MTITRFFTVNDAADAIVDEMNIAKDEDRAYAARCHAAALVDAIGRNAIIYRDPISRLPITREGIVAVLVAHSCVVSDADLNAWLDSQGVGVRVTGAGLVSFPEAQTQDDANAGVQALGKPTSAELASVLGPYLSDGRDAEWLERRLNDADRSNRLKKYRTFEVEGKRRIARWDVGAVVLHLIESDELTRERAKEALTEHYPRHLYVLDRLPAEDEKKVATWFSI